MFRTSAITLRTLWRVPNLRHLHGSTSTSVSSHGPNAPLELDPSLEALLKDADMALLNHKTRRQHPETELPRELEILSFEETEQLSATHEGEEEEVGPVTPRKQRKSPAASFGSQAIGSVYIPSELRNTIERLIAGAPLPPRVLSTSDSFLHRLRQVTITSRR